jgi:hypothetical protein
VGCWLALIYEDGTENMMPEIFMPLRPRLQPCRLPPPAQTDNQPPPPSQQCSTPPSQPDNSSPNHIAPLTTKQTAPTQPNDQSRQRDNQLLKPPDNGNRTLSYS